MKLAIKFIDHKDLFYIDCDGFELTYGVLTLLEFRDTKRKDIVFPIRNIAYFMEIE